MWHTSVLRRVPPADHHASNIKKRLYLTKMSQASTVHTDQIRSQHWQLTSTLPIYTMDNDVCDKSINFEDTDAATKDGCFQLRVWRYAKDATYDTYRYVALRDVETLLYDGRRSTHPRWNGLLPDMKKLLYRSVHQPWSSSCRGVWTHMIPAEILYGDDFLGDDETTTTTTTDYRPALLEKQRRRLFPACLPMSYEYRTEWRGTTIVMVEMQTVEMYLSARISQTEMFGKDERLTNQVYRHITILHQYVIEWCWDQVQRYSYEIGNGATNKMVKTKMKEVLVLPVRDKDSSKKYTPRIHFPTVIYKGKATTETEHKESFNHIPFQYGKPVYLVS